MRKMMSADEINLDEITKSTKQYQEKLLEKREEDLKDKIKMLNTISLSELSNNNDDGVYKPYAFDFKYILNRIKADSLYDNDNKSLQVKIDIAEQISKMKKAPALDTECHIESKDADKSTSIKSLVLKKIFRQNKYRLVFHERKATFEKPFYIVGIKRRLVALMCLEILLSIVSVFIIGGLIGNILFIFSLISMLLTIFIIEL